MNSTSPLRTATLVVAVVSLVVGLAIMPAAAGHCKGKHKNDAGCNGGGGEGQCKGGSAADSGSFSVSFSGDMVGNVGPFAFEYCLDDTELTIPLPFSLLLDGFATAAFGPDAAACFPAPGSMVSIDGDTFIRLNEKEGDFVFVTAFSAFDLRGKPRDYVLVLTAYLPLDYCSDAGNVNFLPAPGTACEGYFTGAWLRGSGPKRQVTDLCAIGTYANPEPILVHFSVSQQ